MSELDFAQYRKHLMIEDYASAMLVPLQPNKIQLKIRRTILDQEAKGIPARLIILKARREGCSTIVQATMAHRGFTRFGVKSITVAHDAPATSALFGMMSTMYESLPKELKPKEVSRQAGYSLKLETKSSFDTRTAGGDGIARAFGYRQAHLSEVAFWPTNTASENMLGVLQTIPNEVGTLVVKESTANGVGGLFYDDWKDAEEGRSDYVPLFFPWYAFDEYTLPLSDGAGMGVYTEEECRLKDVRDEWAPDGVSDEQLNWRRFAIRNLTGNDEDKFRQEYPATADEAFLTSGALFFSASLVNKWKPRTEFKKGYIHGEVSRKTTQVFVEQDNGPLYVFVPPAPNHLYALFVDIAGGISPAEAKSFTNKADAEDYSAIAVVDCLDMTVVATWKDRIDSDLLAIEAGKLGLYYNTAIIAPEMTGGYGTTVAYVLREKGYPRIYTRRILDTTTQRWTESYGWNTNINTRPLMLDNLKTQLREEPWKLNDPRLKTEMTRFIRGKGGQGTAEPGAHDDMVMAVAGGLEIARENARSIANDHEAKQRKRIRRTAKPPRGTDVVDYAKLAKKSQALARQKRNGGY